MSNPSFLTICAIGALVGIVCIVAAIVGGSFKTKYAEFPKLDRVQVWWLGIFGAILTLLFLGLLLWDHFKVTAPQTHTSPQNEKSSPSEAPVLHPSASPKTAQPKKNSVITLHELYEHDFDNTLKASSPFAVTEQATGKEIDFEAQIYQDFPARSKFIGVYLPYTTSEDTFRKIQIFSDVYQRFLDQPRPEADSAFVGEEMMSSKDLTFSGRIFVYHENALSLEQRASLEALYKSKNLSAQFRGFEYLSGKLLAHSK